MNKLIRFMIHKVTIISILILIQLIFFGYIVFSVSKTSNIILYILEGISYLIVIYVLTSEEPLQYKIAWIIPILIAPIFGGLFYVLFKPHKISRRITTSLSHYTTIRRTHLKSSIDNVEFYDPNVNKAVRHLNSDGWPLFDGTKTVFLPSGESKLAHLLPLLKDAKKSIFMEYFILEPGLVWQQIFDVLKDKVKQGVDVRIIYDDFGCSYKQPRNFKKTLTDCGIKVVIFNKMKPRLNLSMNYRDHRKIIVIDSNHAITGGINLADEYMNLKEVYGHWQDAAILLTGKAVWTMTQIFLENWDYHTNDHTDLKDFKPNIQVKNDGYVLPFADSPLDSNFITKHAYLNMIMYAKTYIKITSPYFIIDNELMTALKLVAESGVKVDIVVPGIPDKKYVEVVSEHYYQELLAYSNITIHKYDKGFIHSKIIMIDDEVATVGTTNFDFRSLYLHFENTVWLYKTSSINDIKVYIEQSMAVSTTLNLNDLKNRSLFYKFYQSVLVGFSHLM